MNNKTDETTQAKTKWFAKFNQETKKIEIEINDGITYMGELSVLPGLNIQKLVDKILKAEAEVITKTTSKMEIQIGLISLTLNSTQSLELMNLKAKIANLQTQLKQLKNQTKWEEEDLDSKANFDIDYIYKINTQNRGCSFVSTYVNTSTIYFFAGSSSYTIAPSNRKATNAGHVIEKILKQKI